jgi:hypothetical protein
VALVRAATQIGLRWSVALWVACVAACGGETGSGRDADTSDGADGSDTPDASDVRDDDAPDDTRDDDARDSDAPDSDARDARDDDTLDGDTADDVVGPGAFSLAHVLEVSLDMEPAEWDALRAETRVLFDILGPNCQAGPAPDVFNWREADVVIDGRRLERIGVRKKGFLGSLDTDRPSLRLELDEYVSGQELDGLERLVLTMAARIRAACASASPTTCSRRPACLLRAAPSPTCGSTGSTRASTCTSKRSRSRSSASSRPWTQRSTSTPS